MPSFGLLYRPSRAGSRTIYQHGADVNVLLIERRVAVVNTQSQHRSRKNGGLTQLLALEQTGGRTDALLSKNIDRAVKILHAFFSDCVRSLEWCAVQRQVPSIKFT
jgi:hypothetical protein